tara:strand:+ start:28 stop:282 length:255 start_codon:yes stop_codon:yes gene_type:complete
MNIYIGNLSYEVSETELEQAFTEFGNVTKTKIIKDHETGNSKGFGFVEMSSNEEGEKAIKSLNDQELKGRKIKVNEARPKKSNF